MAASYETGRAQGYIPLYWVYLQAWDAGVPLGGFPDGYYQAIIRYRFRHNLDRNDLWSANKKDIKVEPYHDSTDPLIYYPDKLKRAIRTVTGGDRYYRTVYEH